MADRSRAPRFKETKKTFRRLPDRFEVRYEASCGYGHFHDLLRPLAEQVLLAHSGQMRLSSVE